MFHRRGIVGVVAGLYVEQPRKRSSISGNHKKISFSKVSKKKNRHVAHTASPLMGPSGTCIEIKLPGIDTNHSNPFSAKVKE